MPVTLYAWKTGQLSASPDGLVEFHTVDRAGDDFVRRLNDTVTQGKKDSQKGAPPWLALHIFTLEVPDYVMDAVSRNLAPLSSASDSDSYVQLQLRTNQFRVVSCHNYKNESETGVPVTAFEDAQIISTDIPWYLKAARWIGERIWGFGWLGEWARSAIDSIPIASVMSDTVAFAPKPLISGPPSSSAEPINYPSPTRGQRASAEPAVESPSSLPGTSPSSSSSEG